MGHLPRPKNPYKEAREINSSLQTSEANFIRAVQSTCDWHDADDVLLWKKNKRRRSRRKILDELVPDRKCPLCGETRIGPGEWMVRTTNIKILCRSCYTRLRPKANPVAVSPFTREVRWRINGPALRQARVDAGLSMSRLAELLGVTTARVQQIETTCHSVSDTQKELLQQALELAGVKIIG